MYDNNLNTSQLNSNNKVVNLLKQSAHKWTLVWSFRDHKLTSSTVFVSSWAVNTGGSLWMRGRSPTQSNIRLRYALCRNTVHFKLLLMPGQMSGPRNGGGGAACRTQSSDTLLELFALGREVKCMHLADRPDVCTWHPGRMFALSRQVRCLHLAGWSIVCT